MPTTADYKRLGELLDRRGYMGASTRQKRGLPRSVLRISTTDADLRDWLVETFGGFTIASGAWQIQNRPAGEIVQAALPYMEDEYRVAKARAFADYALSAGRGRGALHYRRERLKLYEALRNVA